MAFTSDGYRPSTPEELAEDSRRIRAAFEPKPLLVPYEAWSAEIDALHREEKITLARPTNFSPSTAVEGERE
ncbi:MAG: hypothetical protein Q8R16_02315, partial [bacterium]|nr:hypothetical protein [bacterium]